MLPDGDRDPWERASATGTAVRDRLPLTDDLMLWGVLVAVVVALVLRLVFLGDRVAHYDEGRVAYWSLHTLDTGHFAYRRIIHGPLLQHLDRYLFGIVGATDFVMRFPVAIIGGLLPASALLFRRHLRRVEVVAMAFILALNPVLLYYSRFMRSDILVAAFMFTALGFLVRYYDTRNHRYLYLVTALVMLGFGSKENAIVYVLTWIGAAFLLADQALYRSREDESGGDLLWAKLVAGYAHLRYDQFEPWRANAEAALDGLQRRASGDNAGDGDDDGTDGGGDDEAGDGDDDGTDDGNWDDDGRRGRGPDTATALWRSLSPLRFLWYVVAIAGIALAVFLYAYAPRGAGYAGLTYPLGDAANHLGLWDAVGNPAQLPELTNATWQRTSSEFMEWFGQASEKEDLIGTWLSYAGQYVRVMVLDAGPLTAFAIFGFLAERYGAVRTRNLVMFAAYGGFVSVIGYPLGTDIWGAWIVVHALVPLSIPAAVGVGVIVRWGKEAFDARDGIGVAIAVLVLLASAGVAGFVAVDSVYTNEHADDNRLVQFAQPSADARAPIDAMQRAAVENDGTDVILYYGEQGGAFDSSESFVKENPATWNDGGLATDPRCASWYNPFLPMPWYLANTDASTDCVREASALVERVRNGSVPVVMTTPLDDTVPQDVLREHYEPRTFQLRTTARKRTLWIADEYAGSLPPELGASANTARAN